LAALKLVLIPSDPCKAAPEEASTGTGAKGCWLRPSSLALPHAHPGPGGLRKAARGGDPISQPENWGSTPIRAPSTVVPFCTPPQVTSFHTQLRTTAAYMYRQQCCCCYLTAGSLLGRAARCPRHEDADGDGFGHGGGAVAGCESGGRHV
jgi:hypothetical protein